MARNNAPFPRDTIAQVAQNQSGDKPVMQPRSLGSAAKTGSFRILGRRSEVNVLYSTVFFRCRTRASHVSVRCAIERLPVSESNGNGTANRRTPLQPESRR